MSQGRRQRAGDQSGNRTRDGIKEISIFKKPCEAEMLDDADEQQLHV